MIYGGNTSNTIPLFPNFHKFFVQHPYWSPPLILVDTIIRDVTKVKHTFSNLRWVSYFFKKCGQQNILPMNFDL